MSSHMLMSCSIDHCLSFVAPEQLRRQDQQVLSALAEKQALLAEILRIPSEDYVHMAEASNMFLSFLQAADHVILHCGAISEV